MNTADIVFGLLLTLGSSVYLARGWRRASRTVARGLALADEAEIAAARERHPSGRAA